MQIETTVPDSEDTCQINGVGCVVPPSGALFYPFYALQESGDDSRTCALVFGEFSGPGIDDFGRDKQYGTSISRSRSAQGLVSLAWISAALGATRANRDIKIRHR
jgi:hypothetical protein